MSFAFYLKHEHACPNVGHCPHLGGAALGTLVQIANYISPSHESNQRQIRSIFSSSPTCESSSVVVVSFTVIVAHAL